VLRKDNHKVEIVDSGKEKLTYEQFAKLIKKNNYDVIAFQTFTSDMESVKKHSNIIKKLDPNALIIIGGPQPSGDPEGTMDYLKNIDFAFMGECEIALPEFLRLNKKDLLSEEKLKKVPNLIWRSKKGLIINPVKIVENLDDLDFPAWDLIDPREYPVAPHGTFNKNFPIAPIIITRGCPYQCTFCAGFKVTGRRFRARSVENIIKEIELLYHKYGVRELNIEDDNFTLRRDLVEGVCSEILKKKLKISWSCPNGIRLDTLDKELIQLMEKAGCYSVAVGIESGSDKILKKMKKNLSKEKVKEKVKLIKDNTNIKVTGFFLLGHPDETERDILETINFAKELHIDKAGFAFMMPLPGTEIWEKWKNSPKSINCDYKNFFYYRIVPLSNIPSKRLIRLYRKAIWDFYFRPKIMIGLISEIKTLNQVKILLERVTKIFLKIDN